MITKEDNLIIRYLLHQLIPEEADRFKQWLDSDPENLKKLEDYQAAWEMSKSYPKGFDPDVKKALTVIHQKTGITAKQNSRFLFTPIYKIASAAAIIFLIIGLTFYFNLFSSADKTLEISSAANEVKEIVLPDSSHIWLNENSSLLLPKTFTNKQRKVTLKGEAYFEIKRDISKPFIISAGKTFTEILGTSFNIKMDTLSGDVTVVVNNGKVAFYNIIDKTKRTILHPNDKGTFLGSENKINSSSNTDANYLSWKTKILTFHDVPLEKVCRELSKLYKKKITATATDKSLTGTFRNEKLKDILNTIELTLDVKTDTSGGKNLLNE